MAQDMVAGRASQPGPALATEKTKQAIPTYISVAKPGIDKGTPGKLVTDVKDSYKNGEKVEATFTASNPRHVPLLRLDGRKDLVPDNYSYMAVMKKEGDKWVCVRTDVDPYTYIHFNMDGYVPPTQATVGWLLRNVDRGTYRLVYNCVTKNGPDSYRAFAAFSSPFQVR
ncbi:MAG: neutral/alkaline non-lysosomal ceramidase C-terminal domain-containing protein [Acutalibacteraceae bacterium]|nr:neutral/alkaline non-lysosomal ceramidase C-terminal domain-containing protein [Acutalibacteraceae bacterium]